MSKINRFFGGKSNSRRKPFPRSIVFRLEDLEDRLVPVVGAYADPAAIAPLLPVQPASQYDGIVRIDGGSGSLIKTGTTGWGFGHEILTAAHVIPAGGGVVPVTFDLQRAGNPVRVPISVFANVAGGAQYQIRHSAYGPFH